MPHVARMAVNSECPLCRLFLHIYPLWLQFDSNANRDITISSYPKRSNGTDMFRELDEFSADSFLAMAYSSKNIGLAVSEYSPITDAGCIWKLKYPAHTTDQMRSNQVNLLNSEVDFTQLNAWLHECCEFHLSSCAEFTELEPISGMRVIDVCTRDIVPATLGFDYAALSYVWGAGDKGPAQVCFPNPAPKTIEDALEVTKRLGIPYLWVDRYCIRQDRKNEKHDQISKMHLIYNNARITIIAAAGSGPDHGIPGIRGTSRIPQLHADLEDGLLVATFPHPTSVIKRSKWASRGWTYQEAALSRRRLGFTEYGAYFECNGVSHSEGIEEPIRRMVSKSPRKLRPRLCGGISAWSSNNIWQHISDFSERKLSYQEDRMNAVLGIFSALEKSGALAGHLWGIPMQAFQASHFVTNLMWTPRGLLRRNPQFPSWSWTGWRGKISTRPSVNYDLPEENYTIGLRVWVELLNGTLVRIEDYQEALGKVVANDLLSRYVHIKAPTIKCRFKLLDQSSAFSGLGTYWSPVFLMGKQKIKFSSAELFTLWETRGTDLERRLITETWDVIFWQVHRDWAYFLVLYRFNDYVDRFGHFWGNFHMFGKLKSISEDRIFRLG